MQITAASDSIVTFEWAYWSLPDREVNDELTEWHHAADLGLNHLSFSGDWQKTEKNDNVCRGKCTLELKPGIYFYRPIFVFQNQGGSALIQCEENLNTIDSDKELKLFANDSGLSRPLVFIILFLCVTGCLILPSSILTAFITARNSVGDKHSDTMLFISAFLLPVILTGAICYLLQIWPFGEKTFLITDMQVQYADYLIYLKGILQGKHSLLYSFSKSIGDDFLSLYAYYLGSPLNWITVLFPIEHFPQAISLIVLARYGLSGLTAAFYFRKVFNIKGETLIFSTAYALISLQFVIAEHIQLRDGAILLPVILLGIERLISHKSTALYIISLSASFLISYYSAYQICFFCVLYFLFRTLLEGLLSWKMIGRFVTASLVSGGLCGVFLVPVAMQLTKGMKNFDPGQLTLTLNMHFSELSGKLFNSAFDMDQTLTSGFPNIFCGLFVSAGLPLFFLNRQIRRREKLLTSAMLILFIAAMQIRALNLILHGFNEPVWWPYRYSYIICFFLIITALRCYQERSGITIVRWSIAVLLTGGLLFCIHAQHFSWFSEEAFYLNLLLSLCMFILWIISAHANTRLYPLILTFCSIDLILNGWMILGEKTAYQRSETISAFQKFFSENLHLIEELNARDNGFYRTEKTYSRDANDAMTLGYQGIGHYSSTLNYSLMKFLPKMGYRYYPWRFLYAEGSDLAADSLLGVRYLITDRQSIVKPYEEVFSKNGYKVFKNPFSLPIAFVGEDIRLSNPDSETFVLQNQIFSALTGRDAPIYVRATYAEPKLQNLQQAGEMYIKIDPDQDAAITWKVIPEKDGMLYLYLSDRAAEPCPAEIWLNGQYLMNYFDGKGLPIIPLTEAAAGQVLELMIVPKTEQICIDTLQLFTENTAVLAGYAADLSKRTISLVKDSDTMLSGEISTDKKGFILFTIPYDKGWKVWIDGERKETEKAFNIFLSAPISGGRHNFLIRYLPEGSEFGIAFSTGTVLILILIGIWKIRLSRQNIPQQKRPGKTEISETQTTD